MSKHDYLPSDLKQASEYIENPVLCPECEGHGGWILRRDAYGKGVHFKCHCMQCNGWGWVVGGSLDASCVHEFTEKGIGNCLHLWTCTKCGKSMEVDSSG